MRWEGLLAGAVLLLAGTPAFAGELERHFTEFGTCYARHYDEDHLRAHPRQRVTRVMLSHTVGHTGEDTSAWDAVLDFAFALRDGSTYSAVAYCDDDVCSREGDGGRFSVSPGSNAALKLTVEDFLELEGADGSSGNLADSDDGEFLIYRARPAACDFG
ncbi:MAG: hypothetical protein EOP19_02580 [Hyphomicrobiales bacterium]|nr:MAG: hypothetical protein EOP19_02580 [Hyphomicrobiales bacterium]